MTRAANVTAVKNVVSFRVFVDKGVIEVFDGLGRAVVTHMTAPAKVGASAEIGIFLDCAQAGLGFATAPLFELHVWKLRPAPVQAMPSLDDELRAQLKRNESPSGMIQNRTVHLKVDDDLAPPPTPSTSNSSSPPTDLAEYGLVVQVHRTE